MCTGNLCRSPMAEALFRQRCDERGLRWSALSVGSSAADRPPPEEIIDVMRQRYGIDLDAHRSRTMAFGHVAGADLVIGMERLHVRDVTMAVPSAFTKTFTLKELVRRGEMIGPCTEPLDAWLATIGAERDPTDLMGRRSVDDVADPYGRSWRQYQSCAAELDVLVGRLVDLLAGARPASSLPPPPETSTEKI